MSRNGSGVYSLPAGSTVSNGDTSDASDVNVPLADLETDMNTPRPVVAGGTGASTAADARTNLGLAIGTNVQAYDAGLTSIAGLTTAADRMIYTTASDVYAVATLTAAGRAILDDADAAAQRTTLGLGALATAASVTTSEIAAATLVTAADTIASNDNDTTIPTSAAVIDYVQASGLTYSTAQVTTSGTAFDFTGIPSWAKRITIIFTQVSLSGTDSYLVQIGSGSFVTSGYYAVSSTIDGAAVGSTAFTTGFGIVAGNAVDAMSGTATLTKDAANVWHFSATIQRGGNKVSLCGGDRDLGATLDRVRITRSGTNTFDDGKINIAWE